MKFISYIKRRLMLSLRGLGYGLTGNMRVFALRDTLLLTSQGLNGGLTVIYTMSVLGASAIDVGLLGSVNALAGILFLLVGGWMGDRYNRKRLFLLGSGLRMLNPLVLALAPSWQYLMVPSVTEAIGLAIENPVGFAVRVSSVGLLSFTRATATLYTIHAIVNMIVPPFGAALVTQLGGLESLRAIFLAEAFLNVAAWVYTYKRLKIPETDPSTTHGKQQLSLSQFLSDVKETYRVSRKEGTWMFLLLSASAPWVFDVDGNFHNVYAKTVCKSSLMTIGFLSSVSAFTSMLLFIPVANLAEKRGRMRVVIMIRPIQYVGYILLILSGTFFVPGVTPLMPILVWALRTAGGVGGPGWEAASIQNMPTKRISTWIALQNFISSVS
ncbi:MAG: MFS transporter, partial [Candidatus Bathyarchaeia archaeon]